MEVREHKTENEIRFLMEWTLPVGSAKVETWYRQYPPARLRDLFVGWNAEFHYWRFDGNAYVVVDENEVRKSDYRDYPWQKGAGAGALGGVFARKQ